MIYILTQAGHNKEISEDTVLVGGTIYSNMFEVVDVPKEGFVCVADGVGGNNAGEKASSFVLEALSDYKWIDDESIKKKVNEINENLIDLGKEDSTLFNMATTLSGVYMCNGVFYVIHVGNTRVYAMQGHYLKQLTSDHTVYNWLKSLGRLEEAETCNKNEITSCFGGCEKKLLDKFYVQSVNEVQTLLLTSDGIHEYVSIDDLEDIINSDISNEDKLSLIHI